MARALTVLGSTSDVGKSLITAGLCRLLSEAGLRVAPFKAQNMANQAGVTADGLEMPRAQILQAHASRVEPAVEMGPVLLKPVTPTGAELVLMGRAVGQREARDYFRDTRAIAQIAFRALDRLAERFEVIVMEGAGSPVELNLMAVDFVNLAPARRLNAGIVLVVDIHKGGVFAQAKGTLDLLPPEDRARVVGLVVNRFKGDISLFEDGVGILERECRAPVLAVVPYVEHGLDEEDQPLRIPFDEPARPGRLHVGAIIAPRTSNTEDLSPLLAEPDVQLTWLTRPDRVAEQDILVLPGSKATVGDLVHLTGAGMAVAVVEAHRRGAWVIGLCGGYQMLGTALVDDVGSEGGPAKWPGLGLLPHRTTFRAQKTTTQSTYRSAWPEADHRVEGYEIHRGVSEVEEIEGPGGVVQLVEDGGAEVGLVGERAVGCYLHGLLSSDGWRAAFLNEVRRGRGMPAMGVARAASLEARVQRWAEHLRANLRPGAWERILGAVAG